MLKLKVTGIEKVQRQLQLLSKVQLRSAISSALNDVGFDVRKKMIGQFTTSFDRPTPYTLKSPYVHRSTPEHLRVLIRPEAKGKDLDPDKYLGVQAAGGLRRDKRSEVALRRAGLLPAGMWTVIPRDPFPGSDDGRGNIKGSFMTRLLSYLQSLSEVGYKGNMTERTKSKIIKSGRTARGFKTIGGAAFFVSFGKLRGQHLHAGVWAKSGVHGAVLKPVLMFVRQPHYRMRLDLTKLSDRLALQTKFSSRLRYQIRRAVGE